jgi:hypothetical protein
VLSSSSSVPLKPIGAQEKLNDKEFNTVIDAEFKIQVIQIICVVVFQLNLE